MNSSVMPMVYFVAPNAEHFDDIQAQLRLFSFDCQVFTRNSAILAAMHTTPPFAVVIDEQGLSDVSAKMCVPLISKLSKGPVIFLSNAHTIAEQIDLMRDGVTDFLPKPFNSQQLIDRLDSLQELARPDPYRVLVVDDSEAVARWTCGVLTDAGMHAKHIQNPFEVILQIERMKPDIILMDVYMPECSGDEIAKIIRQNKLYDSIPIVFLSTETHRGKQLMARSMGGDDFLVKNMEPEELVASISITAERYRQLRRWMTRDRLTALLNHTNIIEELSREVDRAHKECRLLAYAMVDIDHFKMVNDRHGHMVGDRVIKSLSRLLRGGMGKPNSVGRYGGEEFAVILSDHTLMRAAQKLDELRHSFSQLIQISSDAGEFHSTVSIGVAQLQDGMTAQQLIDAADRALYQAKAAGRNQVGLAT
ncbi:MULTISPECIES: diguanylate cyclase [Deefgea]|uniref:diguanylate cyclase n=1 Tax=Deefgea chitinilytica TaxID=570276 RepID=A0ABS2C9J7_9NEIS|nr:MULTISPECIES: diguanylate cyclase [Deefgea]MBM5570819.1 diguanylate cyclase [Deefgea chitinilytica]MBM9888048.1 diguanylate cyclase [Deefgea sp. CFH1-16]